MPRRLRVCLLAGMPWLALAQTVFPSDSMDPHQSDGAELLETVCPGRVTDGQKLSCKIPCPDFTSFPGIGLKWSLTRVTRGHFLSAASDDAVLSMGGCEPHADNYGGSILLTLRSNKWRMLWYKAGVPTEDCHKVALHNGREILVCKGEYGAQGARWTSLYVEDLQNPTPHLMAGTGGFFETLDDTIPCGTAVGDSHMSLLTRARIEKVEFGTGASGRPTISVTARIGRRQLSPSDMEACIAEPQARRSRFLPSTKSYRLDFEFDRGTYKVTPSTAAAARLFADR